MISLSVLLIGVGIGAFLYLTLDEDFEAKPRPVLRSPGSGLLKSADPTANLQQIINTARQAWSIVDKKYDISFFISRNFYCF